MIIYRMSHGYVIWRESTLNIGDRQFWWKNFFLVLKTIETAFFLLIEPEIDPAKS